MYVCYHCRLRGVSLVSTFRLLIFYFLVGRVFFSIRFLALVAFSFEFGILDMALTCAIRCYHGRQIELHRCTNAMQQSGVPWPGWSGWLAKGTAAAANPKRGKNREVKERASSAKQSKTVLVATANTPCTQRKHGKKKYSKMNWLVAVFFSRTLLLACTALHTEESNNSQPALTANERSTQRSAQLLHPNSIGSILLVIFRFNFDSFFRFFSVFIAVVFLHFTFRMCVADYIALR